VLDWLKQLFSPRKAPEVEYDATAGEGPIAVPSGPPTTPHPPAVPVENPVPEESDRQR
jgi:hypothetical protein